jgi:hypothetical protein
MRFIILFSIFIHIITPTLILLYKNLFFFWWNKWKKSIAKKKTPNKGWGPSSPLIMDPSLQLAKHFESGLSHL